MISNRDYYSPMLAVDAVVLRRLTMHTTRLLETKLGLLELHELRDEPDIR